MPGAVAAGRRGSGQHELTDGTRIPGDLPPESVGVREISCVAAPLAFDRVGDRIGSGASGGVQHPVDIRSVGDVVGERHGLDAAPANGPDLGRELPFVPQGQDEVRADRGRIQDAYLSTERGPAVLGTS